MREWAAFSVDEAGGRKTIVVTGPLLISTIGALDRELRALQDEVDTIDISKAGKVDTVGAWTVLRFSREHDAKITGAGKQAQRLLEAVEEAENTAAIEPPRSRLSLRVPETVGRYVIEFGHESRAMIGFAGHIIVSSFTLLLHPSRIRTKAVVRQFELVGVSALWIVGLMSFLIGIVIAQQGAAQLEQFGAEIYTINLTGRLSMRELGVLMTAIMVAGRSGSSFAAQLGTMKLTEEVDAMRTIGVSPMEALVVPRVVAAVLMMPLARLLCGCAGDHRRRLHRRALAQHPVHHLPPPHPGSRAVVRRLGRAGEGAGVRHDHRADRLLPGHAGEGEFRGSGASGPRSRWSRRSSSSSCSTRSSRCSSPRWGGDERGPHRAESRRRSDPRSRPALRRRIPDRHQRPEEFVRQPGRARRAGSRGPPRRGARRGRRLGHRQVGADALDHRAADARRRLDRGLRARDHRRRSRRWARLAQPLGRAVPGRRAVLDADRRRERRGASEAVLSRSCCPS